jgi:hypothetical protein
VLRDQTGEYGDRVWSAAHNGYAKLPGGPVRHQRTVRLGAGDRTLVVSDLLTSRRHHQVELLFHLGPEVTAFLDGAHAHLTWPGTDGLQHATLSLPDVLAWTARRGESDPPLGWFSPVFGRRVPSTSLVGIGGLNGTLRLETELMFQGVAPSPLPSREAHR